jgi:hypothetical protein
VTIKYSYVSEWRSHPLNGRNAIGYCFNNLGDDVEGSGGVDVDRFELKANTDILVSFQTLREICQKWVLCEAEGTTFGDKEIDKAITVIAKSLLAMLDKRESGAGGEK